MQAKPKERQIHEEGFLRQFGGYSVPTDNYRRYRTIWAVAVANAILFFVLAMACREYSPSETLPFVFLFVADMSLVFAFIVNWKRIKPERKRYEQDMAKAAKSKAGRAAAKKKRKEERMRQAL